MMIMITMKMYQPEPTTSTIVNLAVDSADLNKFSSSTSDRANLSFYFSNGEGPFTVLAPIK